MKKPWIILIILAALIQFIILPLIIRAYFIQAFKIPNTTMAPTLVKGDHILVKKTAEVKNSVVKGDIIVFKVPDNMKRKFIKRIIGISGDTVEIKDKGVYVNGSLLKESYVQHTDNSIRPREIEPRDNYGPIVVPQNSFFVLGDNRDWSYDSRYIGFVPKENLVGRAYVIYWSWDSDASLARWERIGLEIR